MNKPSPKEFPHVDWSRNSNIYEVNIRQYTPEGTFRAFEKHLPRLKEMGVDILWLMPIQPIGMKNRKGSLGSYYSIKDYLAVNPEFGTVEDFKRLVDKIHDLKMRVIIDWVANHTAWDHLWATEHPDWYKKNEQGEIHSYIFDHGSEQECWTDVIGLDYSNKELWSAMIEALKYWVREFDIDGYRCDVAGLVPTPFWETARAELEKIKPVFMLAEWSTPELHEKAFDMTYDWDFYDLMTEFMKGGKNAQDLVKYILKRREIYGEDAYRMMFTTNHDKNSWNGSDTELLGPAFKAFAVLAMTLPGFPLIYGGQESILDKRLAFFEKDPIDWKTYEYTGFYKDLLRMKKLNKALWNGRQGGEISILPAMDEAIFAFTRKKDENQVTVIVNLSDKPRKVAADKASEEFTLEEWGFRIIPGLK
ncbi:MAG TPA: alpha-amylase family glycosyl hydrolase [Bacillota bacterium]